MRAIIESYRYQAQETDQGKRLDLFLKEQLPEATRSYLEKLIAEGYVKCDEKVITKNGKKLKGKEAIQVFIPEEEEMKMEAEKLPLDIVYEDEYLLVINKPANMVVHPALGNYTGTLVNALLYYCKETLSDVNGTLRPGIVHRLDKDTTGLIVVAKNNQIHHRLALMFQEKTIHKTYLAIVKGRFSEEKKEGDLVTLIARDRKDRKKMAVSQSHGKKAVSHYKVLWSGEKHSLVEVNIKTGRTHQIRVHMKYLNHPILGDAVYGQEDLQCSRQMLHAYRLEFVHPVTKEEMCFEGKLPEDFLEAGKRVFDGKDIYTVLV
ncbi:RluA family pseudouridine synthase [Fusobacterium necrophorum]|uniref:RluA family pseudouridine synthase n=1 Tax=Fusobacterium necrophorum TaxID=859 RepID=UPI00370F301D